MKTGPHATVQEEMYHRVYRLMKRGTDPRLIAAALKLPFRTVLKVIDRLRKTGSAEGETALPSAARKKGRGAAFLDVYLMAKTRYAVMQPVGCLVAEESEILSAELQKALASPWKAIAVRLSDVTAIDEEGVRQLVDFSEAMKSKERFVAILDPPPHLENLIVTLQIEEKIPIFGTERAFEEHAFFHKTVTVPRSRNR